MDKFTIVFEKCEEGGYHAYMRENPVVQTEGETIQETMENFIDAFELFFRDELEGEIAKQSLDADRFEIEFALAQRTFICGDKVIEVLAIPSGAVIR